MHNSAIIKYKRENEDKFVGIHECHSYLFEVLKRFQTFCNDYHIPCFLVFGSLLGCKRDGGIIPYDDDVDMAVTQDSFSLLLSNVKFLEQYGLKYHYFETTKHTNSNEIRIYMEGFYKFRQDNRNSFISPVYIDVFVARKVSLALKDKDLLRSGSKMARKYKILSKKELRWTSKNFFKYFVWNLLKKIMAVFLPNKLLHRSINRICNSLYLKEGEYGYFFPDDLYHSKILPLYERSWFEDLEKVNFGNVQCLAPRQFNQVLIREYGDWHQKIDYSAGRKEKVLFLNRINGKQEQI